MKRRIHIWVAALAVLCAGAGTVPGAEQPIFAKANQAYSEGHFKEAVEGYESLVRSGNWSANLFYDLGNAWFRLGDFGKAILNYERALALDPHHPEADANLRFARDEARALELKKDWIEQHAGFGTVRQYSIAATVAFWLAVLVAARLLFSRRRSLARTALIVMGLFLCGASAQAIYTLENGARGNALAIVTGKQVEARLATADNAKSVLVLPPGSEIKILSERGDWIYAALPNDQRGWIPANSAEKVRM
jgi:tetratricopeptide (TPR) repeat protein